MASKWDMTRAGRKWHAAYLIEWRKRRKQAQLNERAKAAAEETARRMVNELTRGRGRVG